MSAPLTGARDGVVAAEWRAAVRAAAHVLVDLGAAGPEYPAACESVVAEHGPYIVLAPGLALVHARPEHGGRGVGVAATRLADGVAFGHPDNDPVDLLLAFCTPDPDAHVAALSTLARALTGGLADRLRAAGDENAMTAMLKEALGE
ncbi:PTS system, ascorbate-specific IIA component [Amycolatopsis arida]|uniref:Ascorbate-specific PTS system EIIA component n=1 Tax=Amycolatopsis arida TaxID=587909 RepID=A0A1I5SE06_9PSEU|nr:PTS sugar transporter subunit IIA [Amycolatopsis arida]TDX96506.1 PTS system ascorbate-specific IIA component [Amycolatopsis arida]SFP68965.1 PTS system, ascorbate-specific IIA component [Amycolatopsis arida]